MSAFWGTVTAGRLQLRETYGADSKINGSTGASSVDLAGQESYPPLTRAEWQVRREDLVALVGRFVPVTFTNMSDYDGYYVVADVDSDAEDWTRAAAPAGSGQGGRFNWRLRLELVGPAGAVDIESRITAPGRANDFSQAGERWHAPSVGAFAYTTPAGLPSGSVARLSEDGSLTVYRGVPSTASIRWAAALADYRKGRCRVELDSIERTGTGWRIATPGSGWLLSNALIRVAPHASGTISIATYGAGTWSTAKIWDVNRGGVTFVPDAASVIRNDFEAATVRLADTRSPGRNLLDLTLRRGSRFVECYLQTDSSATLAVQRDTAEAGTAGTGYVAATANDGDGHRYIVGSARTHTALTTQGGIEKAAVTAFDFYLGHVVAGGSAVSGDQAAQLQDQYIGAMAETTMGVRR